MARAQRIPAQRDLGGDLLTMPIELVKSQLGASGEGLSQAEAQARLEKCGFNELPEEKVNPLLKFLSYFWGPIPWMIEVAAILSAVVHHWEDFGIILALLLMNAGVGFWEEFQAGNAIAALKATLALQARVKRAGAWTTIPARELVPGDLMRIRIGDIIPADARLLEGDPLQVDQSALTGESLPVTRNSGDAVYSGSILKQGEIDALVYATGQNTYFGKTAHLVQTAHTVSHFQRAVLKIGDYLIVIAVALVTLILAVALFRGDRMLTTLQFALVLTIAAVPVAMPAVLSVTMAVGARTLARKKAIVTRLAAMEEQADTGRCILRERGSAGRSGPRRVARFPGRKPGPHRPGCPERSQRHTCSGQLPDRALPAFRFSTQTHRVYCRRAGENSVSSHKGRAPGDSRHGGRCRGGTRGSRERSQ